MLNEDALAERGGRAPVADAKLRVMRGPSLAAEEDNLMDLLAEDNNLMLQRCMVD